VVFYLLLFYKHLKRPCWKLGISLLFLFQSFAEETSRIQEAGQCTWPKDIFSVRQIHVRFQLRSCNSWHLVYLTAPLYTAQVIWCQWKVNTWIMTRNVGREKLLLFNWRNYPKYARRSWGKPRALRHGRRLSVEYLNPRLPEQETRSLTICSFRWNIANRRWFRLYYRYFNDSVWLELLALNKQSSC
jgi:hypothetical protein